MFEWDESYCVKVHLLDSQHKRLFAVLQELQDAMIAGHGKQAAGRLLERLIDYTVNHFATEKALLEKCKFPGLAAQRSQHHDLTQPVLALKKEFDTGVGNVTPQLMSFLQDWLKNHIKKMDQGYSDFLNAHGVR